MLLVGLTGGLGAGKSTVARMLSDRGAMVIDADELAREAVAPGSPGLAAVVHAFGRDVLARDGTLDRDVVAREVFAHPDRRRTLETIIHPEVFRLLAERTAPYQQTDAIIVFDVPLLVETGFHEACDLVVVVSAPLEDQLDRVSRDRGMREEDARRRIGAQLPQEERERAADVVLRNDGDLRALEEKVDALWRDIASRARRGTA